MTTKMLKPTHSFIQKAINKVASTRTSFKHKKREDVYCGKTGMDLPNYEIEPLSSHVVAVYSGPDGGLAGLKLESVENDETADLPFSDLELIAGVPSCWLEKTDFAYGIATSLYDCHPITGEMTGEPVADVFGICARENNCILALADGVNWGERAAKAARAAVYGSMEYLNKELYAEGRMPESTEDLFCCLMSSFDSAQRSIIEHDGFLTTLCIAFICKIKDSEKFAVCVCNVGDSYAYVYNRKHGVREITEGSHDLNSDRDLRNPGGALGPVDGGNPDLTNLTCSMTVCRPGDVVFLASDGITDNFDPVVDHIAVAKSDEANCTAGRGKTYGKGGAKPSMDPVERHRASLKAMEGVIRTFEELRENPCTPQELCADLTQHVLKLTDSRRKVLENPSNYRNEAELNRREKRKRDKRLRESMLMMPGKLDHASIVAYDVRVRESKSTENKIATSVSGSNLKSSSLSHDTQSTGDHDSRSPDSTNGPRSSTSSISKPENQPSSRPNPLQSPDSSTDLESRYFTASDRMANPSEFLWTENPGYSSPCAVTSSSSSSKSPENGDRVSPQLLSNEESSSTSPPSDGWEFIPGENFATKN